MVDAKQQESNHQVIDITPPPLLKTEKNPPDYLPQIYADEQGAYVDFKLNETQAEDGIKNQKIEPNDTKENLESVKSDSNEKPLEKDSLAKPKKAIKLITVPQEQENLQNNNNIVNPQEYDSPSIDMKNQDDDYQKDSACLSPNSVNIFLFFFFDRCNIFIYFFTK